MATRPWEDPASLVLPSARAVGIGNGELDFHIYPLGTRSTAEGVVEKGGEEMLRLTQCLSLHSTQTLYSLNQGREVLLEGKGGQWDLQFAK